MHTTNAQDRINPCRGEFSMRVYDRAGNVVDEYKDHNMIVNGAKSAMAYLVSSARQDKVITKFGVGVGTAEATPGDTSLTLPHMNFITGFDYPESMEGTVDRVCFHWSLDYAEANGMSISEFGLFCADGTMFAHKVRGQITKEEDLKFAGDWTIIF